MNAILSAKVGSGIAVELAQKVGGFISHQGLLLVAVKSSLLAPSRQSIPPQFDTAQRRLELHHRHDSRGL